MIDENYNDLLDEMAAEEHADHTDLLSQEPADLPVESYGNQDINELVRHFDHKLDLPTRRAKMQRFAAKTIIHKYGLDRALAAVDAVGMCRGKEYAPTIYNLEDLRDKWTMLETYYQRKITAREPEVNARQVVEGFR